MPILSIYTLLFTKNGKFFIYNSRSNFFSEISEEFYDALTSEKWDSLPSEIIDELKKREIICEKDDKYIFYYTQLLAFNARNHNPTSMSLVLAPTTACNFACPYCFESKQNPKTIDDETVDALVDFVKHHKYVKEISITWYGGEPLLAFNKLKLIYEKLSADDMPKIVSQSVITNGYCINDDVVAFFKEKGCGYFQITIDGLYEKHSATRCLKNSDKDTFWPIVANIDKLVKELPNTSIHIRVNINKNNYKEFISVANFFKERYPENKMIYTYPGIIREETEDKRSLCASSFGESEMLDLRKLLRDAGFDISDFPVKQVRGCMMQNANSFLIGPEGDIYKCWNDVGIKESQIGNIKESELSNASLYINYMMQSSPFNDDCKECHAFPICSGGCSYYRYKNKFRSCKFDTCSPYKDKEKLFNALLTGDFDL